MSAAPIVAYVRRVLRKEKQRHASLTVIFVDSRNCRRLNRQFLSHDYITDVLSFCLEQGKRLEGEIYVNLDRARQQSRSYSVSFSHEVARLVIHGALHLVGYEDKRTADADAMRREEEKHLAYWFS
jgi:rRNA maturation RNase YbeY